MSNFIHAYPVHGALSIQHRIYQVFATTSPPFHIELHQSHTLFVKVALVTAFTYLSHHYFIIPIRETEQQAGKASHWQQATIGYMPQ